MLRIYYSIDKTEAKLGICITTCVITLLNLIINATKKHVISLELDFDVGVRNMEESSDFKTFGNYF